jgi:UbiD family decarboxylase
MVKDLRTFIADLRRESPHEVVEINKVVDPAHYDVTAIIKHLDEQKKFPLLIFNKPLGLNGKVSPVRLCMNAEISQNKIQIALGVPRTTTRAQLGDVCLQREAKPIKPVVIPKSEAPVKQEVAIGEKADLYELPIMRHHEMDGGPYIVMASAVKDARTGIYNTSYHRMEVKGPRLTALYSSPRHLWKIFTDYEQRGAECPVITVLAHHPCFNMGAAYKGPLDTDEFDIIGGYLQEPLRLTASETWGDDFLVPADAEVIIEGVLVPNERLIEGPFGEAPGYLGPQRYSNALRYEVRAITRRSDAIAESIITPEGDKPWLDLPREAAYLRRCREAVPTVTAVCKGGRHAHYNIFISMKKTAEGDPGRVAAAAFTFDHTKNVFVFDEDIDVYNPTEILWALATRVQPHKQVVILKDIMRGNMLDPSLQHDIRTSGMIVDATRPLDRPFSPVSKCPDEAMERVKLEDYIDEETLARIPLDRTTYWA